MYTAIAILYVKLVFRYFFLSSYLPIFIHRSVSMNNFLSVCDAISFFIINNIHSILHLHEFLHSLFSFYCARLISLWGGGKDNVTC